MEKAFIDYSQGNSVVPPVAELLFENPPGDVHIKYGYIKGGAFKLRGAANSILSLTESEKKRGVITISTGNHGKAVAYVGKQLGVKTVVCVSELVPQVKIDAIKTLGARVVIAGKNQEEATNTSMEMGKKEGLRFISAYDDPDVIAGQGTIMLEILKQQPKTDTLIAPVSGGGLMGGMSFVAKTINPDIKIIGVTNDREPAIYRSIKAGHIVQVDEFESLADAITGPISNDNQYTFKLCNAYIDELLLISEKQIAQAMVYALLKEKQVLEGGGAVSIGLLLDKRIPKLLGDSVVAVCSGNSVDINLLLSLVEKYKHEIS
ncbi:threonine dehydratase [Elysia marginata]|uniref:Serine racemase n=1 Tax=Elysia marginata TaxID=1093978 RepID=A0AAV4FWJ6_9GAST|nr:threonine dehydratase [Elysia marginata]